MSAAANDVFGRLTLLEQRRVGGRLMWLTRCACGTEKTIRASHITSGATRSCGCLHDESARTHTVKHGNRRSRTGTTSAEYVAWCTMIARCADGADANYGGRGVRVCDRWRASFAAFLADMGTKPSPQHSIDRKDNDGNYEPGNCRWATRIEQARNKRNSRVLVVNGVSATVAEWAERRGLVPHTIYNRLFLGWSDADAVMTPPLTPADAAVRRPREARPR